VAHWKPISKAKYEMYASELETAKKELTSLEMSLIEAVSAVEKESKAHGKTARKLSRQLYQDQQRLNEVQEQLEEKRGAEETETALNKQLMEEHKTLSASVTEFSRKVVHVCRGPHHVEFNADIHGQAANGSTPLHWYPCDPFVSVSSLQLTAFPYLPVLADCQRHLVLYACTHDLALQGC
jgi:hypothetical protein